MSDQSTTPPHTSLGGLVRLIGMLIAFIGFAGLLVYAYQHSSGARSDGEARVRQHLAAAAYGEPVLKRVLLSTGGVGYFEYEARVAGSEDIELPVRMDQVDDVLKSIVVFDDKGHTGFVQLPSRAPLSDIFRGLPFGPNALDSNAALLDALKGAEVSVRADNNISGRIVSVTKEDVKLPNDEGTTTKHRVGVMTSSGLRQFLLEDASNVTFTDPVLSRQVDQALAAISEHREGQARTLKIRPTGDGPRTVTIAYVVEAPLWKSSYRVTTKGDGKARLQGWAVLENVTGTDWVDVDLTVVTGNPVTFRQALYATYYVDRPEVPVEVQGRILPKPDEGAVATAGEVAADEAAPAPAMAPPPPPPPPAPSKAFKVTGRTSAELKGQPQPEKPLAAISKESATQVTFHMPFAVTVMNGQSLAVPIVDQEVPGELVSFYQPDVDARHPLAALKLVNNTEHGLAPGVLTFYNKDKEGTTDYQGDAQLATLPAAEARMFSFALDQKVLIDREEKTEKRISKATLSHGIFKASIVDDRTTVYTIKGAAKEDRRIVVEHPRAAGWVLVTPDPKVAEMTDTAFRIPIDVKAGTTVKQTVSTQWPRDEELQLVDIDTDEVLAYAENENLTPAQRAAFAKMGEMKRNIEDIDTKIENENAARDRVFEDENRIRENIKALPAGSEIQTRFLREMSKLEDEADQHKKAIETLTRQRTAEQQRLADYVAGLQL